MSGLLKIDGSLLPQGVEGAMQEIRECNSYTGQFGLTLKEEEIGELVQCRVAALQGSGRVEFGGGIMPKLIHAFCDSPFIEQESYAETLADLQEAFYYYKTDSCERYTDDELIEMMVTVFNGRAQGSTDYLISTALCDLARYARTGFDPSDANKVGDVF